MNQPMYPKWTETQETLDAHYELVLDDVRKGEDSHVNRLLLIGQLMMVCKTDLMPAFSLRKYMHLINSFNVTPLQH